jgi:hypothetical protein
MALALAQEVAALQNAMKGRSAAMMISVVVIVLLALMLEMYALAILQDQERTIVALHGIALPPGRSAETTLVAD